MKSGLIPELVVLSTDQVDFDPFELLDLKPEPQWLQLHRFYHRRWREALSSLCREHSIELTVAENVFDALPDSEVLIVAGLAEKVPEFVLNRFGVAALNIHPSLLPSYRGPQPETQIILAGERLSGVTIHTMTHRFDSGPIRWQSSFRVPSDATVGTLEQHEAAIAAHGIAKLTSEVSSGWLHCCSAAKDSYFPAYSSARLLNLANCSTREAAKRLLRLRPEGYPFVERSEGRLYPLKISNSPKPTDLSIVIGKSKLHFSEWIEVSRRTGTVFHAATPTRSE